MDQSFGRLASCFVLAFSVAACESSGKYDLVTATGVKVNAVNADVFEVMAGPGAHRRDFWCGAGDYARRILGAPDTARVYVVGGAGPGVTSDSRDAAQFALKPLSEVSGATGRAGTWGPKLGDSSTVGNARGGCRRSNRNDDDR